MLMAAVHPRARYRRRQARHKCINKASNLESDQAGSLAGFLAALMREAFAWQRIEWTAPHDTAPVYSVHASGFSREHENIASPLFGSIFLCCRYRTTPE